MMKKLKWQSMKWQRKKVGIGIDERIILNYYNDYWGEKYGPWKNTRFC
jgi:hypothetical protein